MRRIIVVSACLVACLFMAACSSDPPAQPVAKAPSPSSSPAATKKAPAPTPKPKPTPKVPVTILAPQSGNGQANTAPFTAPAHWKLTYTYDCSSFGYSGNFQVYLYKGSVMVDILANELGSGGTKTVDEYDSGSNLHMQINSECNWTVSATSA